MQGLPLPQDLPETLNPEQAKAVLLYGIINNYYTDIADEIVDYEVDGDNISGTFRDGDRLFEFTIANGKIEYGLTPESMPKEEAPDVIRFGEIYNFAEPKPTTAEDIATNPQLVNAYADHLAKWQERIEIARSESADFAEFQERIAGIFEGMERSRQKLAKQYAQADRTAYLAGIAEAEEDGN